jgi:hypothetical protein
LRIAWLACISALLVLLSTSQASAQRKTEHVILFMTDGLRWQEVFRGLDPELTNQANGRVTDPAHLQAKFGKGSAEQNRAALMPFLWEVIAKQGQLYGNIDLGSKASVTNGKNFSYPGYHETLCGFADARIDSNDKKPNPNATVFEWLNKQEGLRGRVAAFGSWDVFPYIFNVDRAGLPVNVGQPVVDGKLSPEQKLLNRLKLETPRRWEEEPFDSMTYHSAKEYLKANRPRALYIGLGETDELAHEGRYGDYLIAANRVDSYLQDLWETIQSIPLYRGKTTLIVTTDHGRGNPPLGWRNHGATTAGSENIWIAIIGPDTPPLGERKNIAPVTQSQIAATMAAALGFDYPVAEPRAAQPIPDALNKNSKSRSR